MAELQVSGEPRCVIGRMGHHQERGFALVCDLEHQVEHDLGIGFIKVPGGFIRKDQFRSCCQRARDGDALLLSARQALGIFAALIIKPEPGGHVVCPRAVIVIGEARLKRDIGVYGQAWDQVELLKHHPDSSAPQGCAACVIKPADLGAVEEDLPAICRIKPADQMKKGALAAARLSCQRQSVGFAKCEAHTIQNLDFTARIGVAFSQVVYFKQHISSSFGLYLAQGLGHASDVCAQRADLSIRLAGLAWRAQ